MGLQVFCSKVNPNCGACPMQATCDYARNNGKRLGAFQQVSNRLHDML